MLNLSATALTSVVAHVPVLTSLDPRPIYCLAYHFYFGRSRMGLVTDLSAPCVRGWVM